MFILTITICRNESIAQREAIEFLTVEGEVKKTIKVTIDELIKLPTAEIKGKDKDGIEHLYKGVALVEIVKAVGAPLGAQLRGENLAKYIVVQASDGYQVIFSLPEIDPEFSDEVILLAYQVDGRLLPNGEGPFRLVVPHDKKHARWIRQIQVVKILSYTE
jgi:DMSO/TMAO reductase YedYZ molybdopterin-dependent catalytic subunit